MKKLSLKASCLCGGIQLKTNGCHRNIQNCHCIQCMKTHGHYAAYTNVDEQNIKFIKKRNLIAMNNYEKCSRANEGEIKNYYVPPKLEESHGQDDRNLY